MKLEEKAIKFIQTIARNTNQPLYAGNSGGKDSAVLDLLLHEDFAA
jgi:tRNA(Ile)-lysidine synthase TilS/MesJ